MTIIDIAEKHIKEEITAYKLIDAKFDSIDPYGTPIHQGEKCYYDIRNRQVIHPHNIRRYAASELVLAFDPDLDEEDLLYDRETTRQVRDALRAFSK